MERNSAAYYTKIQKQSSSKHCQSKKDIMNPTKIANASNNVLINIGPNLSKTILDSSI